MNVQRLSRITMVCGEPDRSAHFYEAALGFVQTGEASIAEPAFAKLIGIHDALCRVITLQLGEHEIELVGVQPAGKAYPRAVSGRDSVFQHCAIVVSDMASAYGRLSAHAGWETISTDGPQLLPTSSGGVTAYKFRDPDGHPLELIAFARDAIPVKVAEVFDESSVSVNGSATKPYR
jgi:catechol 2,3-dioxygenase-like lactoylglutathione lyase family enzyme